MALSLERVFALTGLAVVLLGASLTGCRTAEPEPFVATDEASVKPGINENFLDPELEVDTFTRRFEGESREVFVARRTIVEALGIRSGQDVVDVGSGTGAFLAPLSEAVGPEGTVYALDIAPNFVAHLGQRAIDEDLPNVVAQLCSENSVDLPANSIDLAFICDVYHHFEFPRNSMGSLHHALRDGGEVVIVDFERIPGVSREWILGHVRAGKAEVFDELDSYGFELVEELEFDELEENWVARFRKR